MLLVSECVAKAALQRTESRGGHTRDDHPSMEADWRKTLLVCRADGDPQALVPDVTVTKQDQIPMRADLLDLSSSPSWRSTTPTRNSPSTPNGAS